MKLFGINLLALVALLWVGSCQKSAQTPTQSGSEGRLKGGECVTFTDYGLTLCLKAVEESRCPCNTVCVWEGMVACTLEATPTNGAAQTLLLQTNSTPSNLKNSAVVNGTRVTVTLEAPPVCEVNGQLEKYVLKVVLKQS